jgi:hypothetical protein
MSIAEACTFAASPHLRGSPSWCAWQQEILAVLMQEWHEVLGDVRLSDIDWSAWRPFYEEGRSPRAAVARAFERDL